MAPERANSRLWFGRSICADLASAERREWLVTNGIGGFASGTIAGTLTRRYHGLLVAALEPPLRRTLLMTKLDETIGYGDATFELAANRWGDGSLSPRGYNAIERFELAGSTPVWQYALGDALFEKRIWMEPGANTTYVRYAYLRGAAPLKLALRAFANYRDFHGNTHAGDWHIDVSACGRGLRVDAFVGARPFVLAFDRGEATIENLWYRDYALACERERGLDDRDDHLALATIRATLEPGQMLTVVASDELALAASFDALTSEAAHARRIAHDSGILAGWRAARPEAAEAPAWLERCVLASDAFIVARPLAARPEARSVIAGYPWFGDWGRDTAIALRGLTLLTGRPEIARNILTTFAAFVVDGLLPNFFPDGGQEPTYSTADAALWYVEAAASYVAETDDRATLRRLWPALTNIIDGYAHGTHYGIALDPNDGLMRAGVPGLQLTWMDAKVGEVVITPRIGKPVEISALWYNALERMARLAPLVGADRASFDTLARNARTGFERFWNATERCAFDVLDGPDGNDATLRPNQLFAVALPFSPLPCERQRAIVALCGKRLFASTGLRSLDPHDARYIGTYGGSPAARDAAYHQGTSWIFLLGIYASAYARAFGDATGARALLDVYEDALRTGGLGTLGEIADGNAPFEPRGAIAQAWSVALAIAAWHDAPELARHATGEARV